jgi:MFS family permease
LAVLAIPAPTRLARTLGRHGIHYAWIIVAVMFVALLISAGMRAMPGVLILPLESEFGWDRASITLAVSINLLLFGMSGPIVGRLMDRQGPRVVAICAVTLMSLGALGTTVMTQVWQLDLLWGFVVGAGAGGMAMVMVASITNRWFVERRGLVAGILSAATSTGQIIFIPLVMWLAVNVGWRVGVLLAVSLLLCVVLPLLILVLRDDPKQVGQQPFGESKDPVKRAEQDALRAESTPMRDVVRSRDFWWLAGGFFVCGFTANGLVGTHFVSHAADHGFGEVTAASIFGLMGGVNILGTIASGMLADRVKRRRLLLASYYGFRGSALLVLPFIHDARLLTVFAILYGLNWFATSPVNQILTADLFGRRSVGQVYGWVFFSHQAGAAIAATFGGLVHNWSGEYQMAFLAAGLLGLAAAGFSLQIREGRRMGRAPQPAPA